MITLKTHLKVIRLIILASLRAKRGKYSYSDLLSDGERVLNVFRDIGCKVELRGRENLERIKTPSVFIANHMSTLETLVLPTVLGQNFRVTFVVKASLLRYPFFGQILRLLNPIAVTRENPREDLKIVLKEGTERLSQGISVIVFPQATRQLLFDPSKFNTLGIKLAKRAEVPAVPVALRTDAWGVGRVVKDFGKVDPMKPICFSFGEPLYVVGRGNEEHQKIIEFIQQELSKCYN